MYNVSNAYKAAIVSSDRETYIAGTITLADSTTISITNSKIKQGSLYYTNQCVSDDGFSIGHTHRGKQGLTIYDNVTNYRAFKGAKIELIYYLKISATEYEGVPLGIFTIDEATRPTATTIKLVGYDNMTKFDVDYPLDATDRFSLKTPFQRIKDICTALGVELWDADVNVQAQFNLMPNGTTPHLLAFSPEIVTARDYLDYLCQLLCGFATIDRNGKLRIVCWRLKGTITAYDIPDNLRKSSVFSDTVLKYSAVNMSVSFYEGADDKLVKNITAPETPTGAGEVLSLYSNALIRGTLYNNAQTILNNIASVMTNTDPENGTVMRWLPCDIQYTGDPALDLGDWVTYTGYTAGDGVEVPIHKIDWKYRGWQRLETLDMNRKSEKDNQANRARQEELATIIKSGVGAKGTGENAEIFNDYENNVATGSYSHASGRNSTASGRTSFASGESAIASAYQSVALGGISSEASGNNSVAMGGGKAIGDGAFAMGDSCEARKNYSVVLGSGNKANSSSALAIGYYNIAGSESGWGGTESVAIGYQNKTTGDRAVAMGYMCEAGSHAFAIGESNKATGRGSTTVSGNSNIASGDNSAVLGGQNNKATNSYSAVVGGGSNEANGPQSVALGGSTNKTSGYYSATVGGYKTIASGSQSVAMGSESIAKGTNQLALGKYNVEDTTNQYALVIGGGTSTTRKNIFTVDWAGNVECTGTVNGGSGSGADGKSAYEIWLDNGNVGTELEFLASLKGQDGSDGVNGADGANGTDGYTPVKGTDYFTVEDIASLGIAGKADITYVDGLIGDINTILASVVGGA